MRSFSFAQHDTSMSWRLRTDGRLPTTVPGRNHTPILRRAGQAVKHAIGGKRNSADGFFSVALTPQIGCHRADHVWAILQEHHSRVIAHALEFPVFIGDL